MSRYAEKTTVSVSRSREEIESTLRRFRATADAWMRDDESGIVLIAFKREGRAYRFRVPLANLADFKHDKGTYKYSEAPMSVQQNRAEAENRRRFRSLANYMKATLDAVDTGIVTFEDVMLSNLVLPSGRTVGEETAAQLPALMSGQATSLRFALTAGRAEQ